MIRMIASRNTPFSKNIDISFAEFGKCGSVSRFAVATDITMTEVEDGAVTKPLISIKPQVAQELMDTLWQCGLRPSEGSGSAGSLSATERHLADMEKIAFHALKIDK